MVIHALSAYLLVSMSCGLEGIADPSFVCCLLFSWMKDIIMMRAEDRNQFLQKLLTAQLIPYILKYFLHINEEPGLKVFKVHFIFEIPRFQ